ncbi:cytosolic Fe-S cluster assembling factor CFD1 [Gautieria morchelliformis]|nr:cytosolic Fe-S cluster assembling factor CFD1 [Gautieria morchelliformis]
MALTDTPVSRRLQNVKHIIIVLSGKGGVGKSSVATQLALSLYASPSSSAQLPRVGILDVDLTGPSIPRMLGLDKHGVHQSSDGWVPVYADGATARLACMSVGFLLKRKEDSVVWRGPKKNAMIRQFLSDVRWGELDYLVVDTPPGTSDEHLSLMEHLAPLQAQSRLSSVLVTTPQVVALTDAMKCLSFTRAVSLPVLGLVENMSGYVCPCCGEITNVFSTGGGEEMARREGLPFLGALPVDTQLVDLLDSGGKEDDRKAEETNKTAGQADRSAMEETGFVVLDGYRRTPTHTLFKAIADKIIGSLENLPAVAEPSKT